MILQWKGPKKKNMRVSGSRYSKLGTGRIHRLLWNRGFSGVKPRGWANCECQNFKYVLSVCERKIFFHVTWQYKCFIEEQTVNKLISALLNGLILSLPSQRNANWGMDFRQKHTSIKTSELHHLELNLNELNSFTHGKKKRENERGRCQYVFWFVRPVSHHAHWYTENVC